MVNPLTFFGKLPVVFKIILLFILILGGWFGYTKWTQSTGSTIQYTTAKAERDLLVVSIRATGQVYSNNSAPVNTQASGVISKLYVQNGALVKAGDPIAELELDLEAQQKYNQALASYQSAQNAVQTAKNQQLTLQSTMLGKWDTYKELSETDTYKDATSPNRSVPEFYISQNDWLAAEAEYKKQSQVIAQAQTALNSAWLSYQQSSPTILAPISGTVSGLSLQIGSVLASQSSSSDNTATSQKVASVETSALPMISLNLSEIDVPKVKADQKATVTIDALPDKSFTGSVVSVDRVGTSTSGVTTYQTIIQLDSEQEEILPNMSASASIILATKDNALLVPVSAVQTQADDSTVQVMQHGQPQIVPVETGLASDAHVEILSGLKEGAEVVTATISTQSPSTQTSTSPFGGFGGRSGGTVRIMR